MGGTAGTEEEAQVGPPDGRSSVRLRPFAWSRGAFHLPLHPSFSPTFMQQVPRGDSSPPTCMCAHTRAHRHAHTHSHTCRGAWMLPSPSCILQTTAPSNPSATTPIIPSLQSGLRGCLPSAQSVSS